MSELKYYDDFRAILANYQPSETTSRILRGTRLVLLVGPSAAGRNTIINRLVETGAYHFVVSDTTRQPRVNDGVPEQNGREYWFRTEEELLQELREGKFLEAAIIHDQQVSGISVRELEKARADGRIAIDEVQIDGAANVHRLKPDCVIVFVAPPSFEEWLQRLHARGKTPADEIRRRLESSCEEFSAALEHDYYAIVINDELEQAVADVQTLAAGQPYSPAKAAAGRAVVEQLLQGARAYLKQVA